MLIDKTEIERVKQTTDLVTFIRDRGIKLTRKGKQLVGLCIFHKDSEPSLIVDPVKQLWNCLGACNEGGDIYRFVMKADGVDFPEAHRRLGGTESQPQPASVDDLQWLQRAADHYHQAFLQTPKAQDYAHSRGLRAPELATTFRVGYANGSLIKKLSPEGKAALRRIGVLSGSGQELMRGCIIFPLVASSSNQVVNLYGRHIERKQHLYLPGERRVLTTFSASCLLPVRSLPMASPRGGSHDSSGTHSASSCQTRSVEAAVQALDGVCLRGDAHEQPQE